MAGGQWSGADGEWTAQRRRRSLTTILTQNIREDFGTLRTDYILSARDTFSATYTIDDGNSLIPQADPLFGSYETLRSQIASVEETHVISPEILNTFRAGFSRAALSYDAVDSGLFPSQLRRL